MDNLYKKNKNMINISKKSIKISKYEINLQDFNTIGISRF